MDAVGVEPTVPFGRKIYSLLGLPIFLHIHNTTGSGLLFTAKSEMFFVAERILKLERDARIELATSTWKDDVLPLN